MKSKLLLFLVAVLFSIPPKVFSIDSYYYNGERTELKIRTDKIAVILNHDGYSETFVLSKLSRYLNAGDELDRTVPDVYLLNFSSAKSKEEAEGYINALSNEELVKFSTLIYYGSSKSIIQIPTDKLIVRLKNSNDKEKLEAMNIINRCEIIGNVFDEKGFLLKSNHDVSKNALELSAIYFSTGLFEYAEPDFLYPEKCLLLSIPNDLNFPAQWALNNTGQTLQTGSWFLYEGDWTTVNGIPDADMNVADAWDFTTGSQSVKVGVIDTGIDSLHPDFQAPDHLLCGYDAFYDVNSSATDLLNHGTPAAGLIGAVMNNFIGISGIAPDCQLMSIRIFDESGNTSNSIIARAFDTARVRGIDVLSNSWGGLTPSSTITNAINDAADNGRGGLGCAIFFASGNDGRNPPLYPSTLPGVLCVGASTPHDQKKSPGNGNHFFWGSNYGEDNIGDIDITAPTNCYTLSPGGGYNAYFWGTSCTAPNAAGVAALVLSVNLSQTRQQVYENLARGCDKIDNVSYSVNKNFGKWNYYYGYGRVNALNSVRLAAGVDVTPPTINQSCVPAHSSTYPTIIMAEIIDHDGAPVPLTGNDQPKLFFKTKKYGNNWTAFDSITASSISGNVFTFKIPSQGWETEVQYYVTAKDNSGNVNTFPKHAPNPFWLCYFSIGKLTCETAKIGAFAGADYGSTVSPGAYFTNFKVVSAKIKIYMRHTWLDDEVISIFAPLPDVNNNRKCLFSSNGGDMDNITGASSSDSASMFWKEDQPSYWNGHFRPEFNLKGLNGQNASGNWRILHFDRALSDYAFFDSVRITLGRTTGERSAAIRLDNPMDSILVFDSVSYPNSYEKNFYLKNNGTANLTVSNFTFTGTYAPMFFLINQPSALILPNDSGVFRIRLSTDSYGFDNFVEDATFNMQTNDPSKGTFSVSLQTTDSLYSVIKNLNLTALIEGLYYTEINSAIPDTSIVYLRENYSPYSLIDSSRAATDSNGFASFSFMNAQNNVNYYLMIKHRNSIETWSAMGQSFRLSELNYDFTSDSAQAYGNNLILKGTKFCIYSGDLNGDGIIDAGDMSMIENVAVNFGTGYLPEDLNGDEFVDATDLGLADNNAYNLVSKITP